MAQFANVRQHAVHELLVLTPDADTVRVVHELLDAAERWSCDSFRIRHVHDVEEAQAVLQHHTVDVALLEVSVPADGAVESFVTTVLGAHEIPVLLLGAGGDDLARQATDVGIGVQNVLVRDQLNPYWLVSALRYAIERHYVREEAQEHAARLLASEQRFRTMIEENADGVLIVDRNGTIQFANRAAEDLLGQPREALVGSDWGFPVLPAAAAELDILRNDERCTVEMRAVSLDWDGQPAALASLRDVTARSRAQEGLEKASEELRQSNEELRAFADIAGHDLREPLRSITLYLELLQQRYEQDLSEEARHFVRSALNSSRRMRQLIDALLQYTRVDHVGAQAQQVDVGALLERTIAYMEAAIRETQATIAYDELPTVWANPSQLGQVFQNMLSNALKFSGEAPPRIDISARREGRDWVFAVADRGIGFEPVYATRIFEMFEQLHDRGRYPGTGMGLTICEKIINRHGGRIWVEAMPGLGATFYFTLPAGKPS